MCLMAKQSATHAERPLLSYDVFYQSMLTFKMKQNLVVNEYFVGKN